MEMVFVYFTRFSLQLLFCEALFAYRLPRRDSFALRAAGSAAAFVFVMLLTAFFTRDSVESVPAVGMLTFAWLWLLTMVGLSVCLNVRPAEAIFVGIGGYSLQHAGYSLGYVVGLFLPANAPAFVEHALLSTLPYLLVGGLSWLVVIRRGMGNVEVRSRNVPLVVLSLCVLACNIVFSELLRVTPARPAVTDPVLLGRAFAVLCSFMSVAILFGIGGRTKLERDMDVMTSLLRMESEQHRMRSESVNLINMKYHDLRHQLERLKRVGGADGYVAEAERSVAAYDAAVRTGSDELDLILTEKRLVCENRRITMSVIADGARLSFMSAGDMYSLFGNALDNAIEATAAEPDEEKRLIGVRVSAENNVLLVHIENRCVAPPEFEDGMPVTSKADKDFHGFGVRSIRYIAEKYGGRVRYSASDGKFELDILFFV